MSCQIPLGESGDWRVIDTPTGRQLIHLNPGPEPRGHTIWMVDTPQELETHKAAITEAHRIGGHILVTGLGLAITQGKMLDCESVQSVTTIEQSEDVIKLVLPTMRDIYGKRFVVIVGDAMEPELFLRADYDFAYHDFKASSGELQNQRAAIMAKYGSRCKSQMFWECA